MSKNVIEKLVTIEPQPTPENCQPKYELGGSTIYTIYIGPMVFTRTRDGGLAKIRREYIIDKLEKWFNNQGYTINLVEKYSEFAFQENLHD